MLGYWLGSIIHSLRTTCLKKLTQNVYPVSDEKWSLSTLNRNQMQDEKILFIILLLISDIWGTNVNFHNILQTHSWVGLGATAHPTGLLALSSPSQVIFQFFSELEKKKKTERSLYLTLFFIHKNIVALLVLQFVPLEMFFYNQKSCQILIKFNPTAEY